MARRMCTRRYKKGRSLRATNSDSAFLRMLGSGADYQLAPHWSGQGELDLLRNSSITRAKPAEIGAGQRIRFWKPPTESAQTQSETKARPGDWPGFATFDTCDHYLLNEIAAVLPPNFTCVTWPLSTSTSEASAFWGSCVHWHGTWATTLPRLKTSNCDPPSSARMT